MGTRAHPVMRTRYGRRQALRTGAAGLGGMALWLAACGGSDDKPQTTTGSNATTTSGAASPAASSGTAAAAKVEEFKYTNNAPDLKATPKKGGTLRFSTHVTPPSLDPIKSASYESANIYTPVYNRLLRAEYGTEMNPYNPWQLKLKGDLAQAWEHPDSVTHVLKLRSGVKYQDVDPVKGRAFTSADAKYSLDAFLANPETASQLPFKVEAPDAQTIKLTLSRPANYVLQALQDPRFVMLAREVAEADGDFSKRAIGTGPFILEEMVPNTRARYKRNPAYWRTDRPYLDAMQFDNFKDNATSKAALISGQYEYAQYALFNAFDDIPDILASRKDTVVLKLQSRWQSNVFQIGFASDKAPYSDVRVRTAISKGFDRAVFGKKNYQGDYNVLGAYAWTDFFDAAPDLGDAYKFDVQAAKQMLQAAGVTTPFEVPLDYFVYGGDAEDQLQTIQDQLKAIGVELKLQKNDYTAFLAKYYGQKVDNAITSFIPTTPRWTPLSMFTLWRSGQPKNYLRVNSPDLDRALDKLVTTEDQAEMKKAYQDAWFALHKPAYFLSMAEAPTNFVHSPKLHGLMPNMYNDPAGWGNQAMEDWWVDA
jgi:peptide/nickel transport system substrate-binding protein